MAQRNLLSILLDAQAYLDLDASTTPTGSDLTTRANYANQAVLEAASTNKFAAFNKTQIVSTSGGTQFATLASVTLASNFREFNTAPVTDLGGGIFQQYVQIKPEDRYAKNVDDKYCYVLGNPSEGFTAVFNRLTANATLSIDYQRYPSGLLTLTDVCELPDDLYVVEKIKSYVLQSRTDERFPIVEANAGRILVNMTGREDRKPTGGVNTIPKLQRYRIGE